VRVPAANLLGGAEGQGFYQLMGDLPYERALIAVVAVAAMEGRSRKPSNTSRIGRPSARPSPNSEYQFKLAEIATKTHVARVFVDDCIAKVVAGTLDTVTASMRSIGSRIRSRKCSMSAFNCTAVTAT